MATVDIRINGVATPNESLNIGDTVTLTNADNTGITVFEWQLVSKPAGSIASLVGGNTDTATFIVDVEGAYLVRLLANGGLPGTVDGLAVARVVTAHLGLKPLAKGETSEGDATQGWAKAWREAYLTLDKALGIPADRRTFYYNGAATTGPVVLAPTGGVAQMDNGDIVPTMTLANPSTPPGLRVLFESGSLSTGFVTALSQGLSDSLAISPVPSAGTAFYVGAAGALTTTAGNSPPVGYAVSGSGARLLFSSGGVAYGSVSDVGTVTSDGTSAAVARADHVHAHGDKGGGTLHAEVTSSTAGFMSAADKTKLDLVDPALIPTAGQKDALAGTSGTPGSSNQYVTNADARMTNSRTPTGAASGDLSGTYPSPTVSSLQGYSVSMATAPAAGQTLSWNGGAWVPASAGAGGGGGGAGGGGVTYYLNSAAATSPTTGLGASPRSLGRAAEVAGATITSSPLPTNGAYLYIAGFVTPPSDPGVTSIPAGIWDFNVWATASNNQAYVTVFRVSLYKYDGTAATLIASSDPVYIADPQTTAQYTASVVVPQTTVTASDRIYAVLEGRATSSGHTITVYLAGATPSHTHTTVPTVAGTGIVHVVNGVFQSPASPVNLQGGITEVSGTLPIVRGGTAVSTTPSNGQLLIGNGTGYTQATITGTNGITVTNGAGSITVEVGTIAQSQVASLTTDLAARALDNAVVHLAGTETVTGAKTFSVNVTVPAIPTSTTHATSKSYVDGLVSGLAGFYAPAVQTLTALRAVVSADRLDKQLRLVEDENAIYRYDAQGTGTDDNNATITPSDNPVTGRWFKVSAVTQNHESLTGLLGGATNDHYHLTNAQLSVLTGATSSNTASTLVQRDASGNFSAGTITAALSGNATSATTAAVTNDTTTNAAHYIAFTTSTSGNAALKTANTKLGFNPSTGTLAATGFAGSGALLTSIPNSATTATSTSVNNAIVARDSSANFSANVITASLVGNASSATNATNATNVGVTEDTTTATAIYPALVGANTGNNPVKTTSTKLTFVPSTGVLSATTFSGSGASLTSIPQSAVTNLSTDLSARPTGSGTATRVAFWSGASALSSNANLYWDNTNSRLGLGTTTPGASLQVSATGIAGAGILLYNSDTSSASVFYEARGRRSDANQSQSFSGGVALAALRTDAAVAAGKHLGTIYFGGNHTNNAEANLVYAASISGISDGSFDSAASSPAALAFYTGVTGRALGTANVTYGNERMRISSSGQVGIGTTSTLGNALLNVSEGVVVRASGGTTPYFQTYNAAAGVNLKTWRVGGNSSGSLVFESVDDAYSVATERVRISSAGYVVVPQAGRLVVGNGFWSTNGNDILLNAGTTAQNIYLRPNGDASSIWEYRASASGSFHAWNGTSGTEIMRLSSSGLGLGVSPSTINATLDVNSGQLSSASGSTLDISRNTFSSIGNITYLRTHARRFAAGATWTTSALRMQVVTDSTLQGYIEFNPESSSSTLAIGRDTTENVRIQANGDVGIGITPAARLHVHEPTLTAPSLTWGADAAAIIRNEAGELAIGHNTASPYNFWFQGRTNVNGTKDIALQPSGGGVSVGTISVLKKFNVNGQIGLPYGNAICFTNGTSATYTADSAIWMAYDAGLTSDVFNIQPSGNSSGYVVIRAGVAAATRSEVARFTGGGAAITGTINATHAAGGAITSVSGTNSLSLSANSGGGDPGIYASGTGILSIAGVGGDGISIDDTNYVGVCTTSPSAPFHVSNKTNTVNTVALIDGAGTSYTGLRIYNTVSTDKAWSLRTATVTLGGRFSLVDDTGGADTEYITCLPSALGVGIRKNTPSATLHVGGSAIADSTLTVGTALTVGTTITWNGFTSSNSTRAVVVDLNNNQLYINSSLSDRQYKENVQTIDNALTRVNAFRGVFFDWNKNSPLYNEKETRKNIGFIAQEVQASAPEWVVYDAFDKGLTVDYARMTPLLVQAINELSAQVKQLQSELAELKKA